MRYILFVIITNFWVLTTNAQTTNTFSKIYTDSDTDTDQYINCINASNDHLFFNINTKSNVDSTFFRFRYCKSNYNGDIVSEFNHSYLSNTNALIEFVVVKDGIHYITGNTYNDGKADSFFLLKLDDLLNVIYYAAFPSLPNAKVVDMYFTHNEIGILSALQFELTSEHSINFNLNVFNHSGTHLFDILDHYHYYTFFVGYCVYKNEYNDFIYGGTQVNKIPIQFGRLHTFSTIHTGIFWDHLIFGSYFRILKDNASFNSKYFHLCNIVLEDSITGIQYNSGLVKYGDMDLLGNSIIMLGLPNMNFTLENGATTIKNDLLLVGNGRLHTEITCPESAVIIKYSKDYYMMEYDWDRCYKHNDAVVESKFYNIKELSDSSIVAVGYAKILDSISGIVNQFAWILRADKYGCLIPGCNNTTNLKELSLGDYFNIYPNPSSDFIYIKKQIQNTSRNWKVRIINSLGREVKVLNIDNSEILTSIDLLQFSSGQYYLLFESDQMDAYIYKFTKL